MDDRRRSSWGFSLAIPMILGAALIGSTFTASAASYDPERGSGCSVPTGTYPTIQSAIDDVACSVANVATGDYSESLLITRTFLVKGPNDYSVRVLGDVQVDAASTQVIGFEYIVIAEGDPNQPLFSDGFETGDTSLWSSTSP